MKFLFVRRAALIVFATLATLAIQPPIAFGESWLGQKERDRTQAKQRGKENNPPRPWEARPWDPQRSESKPWESRPWEAASEELRPKVLRPGEELSNTTDDRRRVGRKARKERLEKENENTEELSSYQDRVKQRQDKWRRHQMESERYYPVGMR